MWILFRPKSVQRPTVVTLSALIRRQAPQHGVARGYFGKER
jgi:hypothetical protein